MTSTIGLDGWRLRELDDDLRVVDLNDVPGLDAELGFATTVLVENLCRHGAPESLLEAVVSTAGRGGIEVPFRPSRLLMQDYTAVPALADIAAARDAVAEGGGRPELLAPTIPVDVVIDHSLIVEHHGTADARALNEAIEQARNAERFEFLRWAAGALPGVRVHPPGSGICHQLNLERLATVATVVDGVVCPDTVIGTDSHTTMVNALGVLGWGTGGLEAVTALVGEPLPVMVPHTVAVRLDGEPPPAADAMDVALLVIERLRGAGVVGAFVLARKAGINKPVGLHTLRHAFITAALDAGVPLRDVQEAASHADPRATMCYDRARVSLDRHATYVVAAFLAGAAR